MKMHLAKILLAAVFSCSVVAQHWIQDQSFSPSIQRPGKFVSDPRGAVYLDYDHTQMVYIGTPPSVTRFLPDGTADTSYTPQLPFPADLVTILACSPDGSLLLESTTRYILLSPSGRLRGYMNKSDVCTGAGLGFLCLGADGRVLVGYFAAPAVSANDFRLALVNLEQGVVSELPCRFPGIPLMTAQVLSLPFAPGLLYGNPVLKAVPSEDGAFILSGYLTSRGREDGSSTILRILADGSIDPSFAIAKTDYTDWRISGLDDTGSLLVYATRALDRPLGFAGASHFRLRSSGSIDSRFVVAGDASLLGLKYLKNGLEKRLIQTPVKANSEAAFTTEPLARWTRSIPPRLEIIASTPTQTIGADLVLAAVTSAPDVRSYRWDRDGIPLTEGTEGTLVLTALSSSQSGLYTVSARLSSGNELVARFSVEPVPSDASVIAFSARGHVRIGGPMILGLVLDNSKREDLFVRSLGRGASGLRLGQSLGDNSLSAFFHPGDQPSPVLKAIDQGRILRDEIEALSKKLGLLSITHSPDFFIYPLGTNLGSAILLPQTNSGAYSLVSEALNGSSGLCLAECYLAKDGTWGQGGFRAASLRARTEEGSKAMTAGISIVGTRPIRLLVRGLGQSLASSGVRGYSLDPLLEIYSYPYHPAIVNDDWAGDPAVKAAMEKLGMQPWDPASKEAAVVLMFRPGTYTFMLRDKNNEDAEGMIEIYVVD